MNNIISIPLPNGDELCAEANPDTSYKEIFVYLKSNGLVHQDLAIIGANYEYVRGKTNPEIVDDEFHIYVYGSEYDECYTESFNVNKYKEEE